MRLLHTVLAFFITYSFILSGCTVVKDESQNQTPTPQEVSDQSLDEVKAPENFDYSTIKDVNIVTKSSTNPSQSIITIYIIDDQGDYINVGRGLSDLKGNLNYNVSIPSYVERLYVTKNSKGVEWYEVASVTSDSTQVIFDNTSQKVVSNQSSNGRIQSCEDKFFAVNGSGKAFAINIESGYSITNYPNLVAKSFANAYDQENDVMYYDNIGNLYSYAMSTGTSTFIADLNTGSSAINNGYPRMALQNNKLFIADAEDMAIINPNNGSVLRNLTINGIPSNLDGGGDLAFSSNGSLYQACSGGLYLLTFNSDTTSVSATRISADNFPYALTGVTFDRFDNLYLSTNDTNSKIIQMDINDGSYTIITTLSKTVNDLTSFRCTVADFGNTDSDNDGVVDGFDEYPSDPNKAFNNYNPGKNGFGTFAFEDLYPEKGDYDFNDIMVHYRHNYITNADNKVVEIATKYIVKSVESSLPSGFGIELPIHADSISNVSGTRILTGVVSLDSKGLESGINATDPCIIVFDNHFGLISGDGFIKKSEDIDMVISFVNPIPQSDIPVADFNPFIFINQDRSREVHLANFDPTQKYNTTLRTSGVDGGNYKTTDGHPWGLHIAHKFHPPRETIDITNAYSNFRSFVESGGSSNSNWYTDDNGNRNTSLMHIDN